MVSSSRLASCARCRALKAWTMEHWHVSQDSPTPLPLHFFFSPSTDLNAPFSVRVFFSAVLLRSLSPTPAAKNRLTWRCYFSPQGGSPNAERPAGVDRSLAKHISGGWSVPSLYSDSLCTLNVHQTFMFIYVHVDVCVLLSSSLKAWSSPSTSRPLADIFSVKEPHH